jgi:hypothetical protein
MVIRSVIISSTGLDLKDYREAAEEICKRLHLFPVAMEYFEAMGLGATEGSKHKIDEADVYVGIYAHRYGYIEHDHDKSVTETEFDYAGQRNLERLCFLVDPKWPWPPEAWDYKNQERLQNFKSRLGARLIRGQFTTVDDLRVKLMHALVEWKERHPGNDDADHDEPPPAAPARLAPPMPSLLIGRENDLGSLKARLGIGPAAARRPLTVIRGWPGVGKTTVVTTLAYDSEVAAAFPDGVLWAALGQTPNPIGQLLSWARALGAGDFGEQRSLEDVMNQVRAQLRERRALLIVDDVWDIGAGALFKLGGPHCATLFTTRLAEVAGQLASTPDDVYKLGQLDETEALELLARLAPTVAERHPAECRRLVNDLEGLPLAIRVSARLLEAEAGRGWDVAELLVGLVAGNKLLAETAPDDRLDPHTGTIPTVNVVLKLGTDWLDELTRERYAYLGAFAPQPATFDLEAMHAVWLAEDIEDVKATVRTLAGRGLLEPIIGTGRFQMHALLVLHAKSLLSE